MKLLADLETNNQGISLVELILIVAMVALLTTASTIALAPFLNNSQLDTSARQITNYLRTAQSNAALRLHDQSWGVYFDTDATPTITLFQGTDYASRAQDFDQVWEIENSVNFETLDLNAGGQEVVFAEGTGSTADYGTVTLSAPNSETAEIAISQRGKIELTD